MIAVVNVEITAANPSMPLFPWRAYLNSPSSLRIRNVPRRVGNWNIEKVSVTAAYPDNSIKSAQCVLVGGIWVCTIEGSTVSGFSQNGYTIYADGKDENGNDVTSFVLGKGDITILESDGTITPGENTYYVHMLSAQPTTPKDGDLWQLSGSWYIYQDGTAYPIGDDSGLIHQLSSELSTKADVSSLTAYELTANMQDDVKNIVLSSEDFWTVTFNEAMIAQGFDSWNQPNFDAELSNWFMRVYMESDPDVEAFMNATGPEDATILEFTNEDLPQWTLTATKTQKNKLGLAMESELSGKQDKLSDPQISAIDSVVDERTTVIEFSDNTTSAFNWVGEINRQTMIDEGLYDGENYVWIKNPFRVKIGNAVTTIGSYAFFQCATLTIVTIPDSVTYIQDAAFNGCGLTSVTIPDSVTTIGNGAFQGCTNLESVAIGNGVTSIQIYAFAWCSGLTSVTIPDSVTSIGTDAFAGCSGLTSVKIIDNGLHNLKTIGDSAFQGCSSLLEITLPQGITSIGVDAFAGTISYFKLYLTEAIPSWVPGSTNYPWGVTFTANIITVRNATKEWVEEQAYGKGFTYNAGLISPRPTPRHINLVPFTITSLTLTSATSSFECQPQGTVGTVAREIYFALTIGNFTQPITWNASCDVFEGGSAAAIAPKPNTTNIYHIFEYASGHFMVSKFSSALDELGDIETIVNAI